MKYLFAKNAIDDAENATNIPYAISTKLTMRGHSFIVAKFVRSYVANVTRPYKRE